MTDEPRFSLCQLGLPDTTFDEDIETCLRIGANGLSIDVNKLGAPEDDPDFAARLRTSGLSAAICVPAVMSFLPMPDIPGPDDPADRLNVILEGIARLAEFSPDCVFLLTGPSTGDDRKSRSLVVEGLRVARRTAELSGVRLCLEPMRPQLRATTSIVCSISEALSLLDEVGADDIGLVLDTWHMWDAPGILEDIERHTDRIYGVQISDYREPRTFADRVLPGDGLIDFVAIIRALRRGRFDGFFDLEVFSDDGRYGVSLPDSIWRQDVHEWTSRGRQGFLKAWREAVSSSTS